MSIERYEGSRAAQERDPSRRDFLRTAAAAATAIAAGARLASSKTDMTRSHPSTASALPNSSARARPRPPISSKPPSRVIEQLNPQLAAVCTPTFDLARKRVRAGAPEGPFGGVPYLLKDLLEYPGVPFASGSRMLASNVSNWRSPYLDATEGAGLVVLGKTATPEFGLTATTEPLLGGPTHNPWDLRLSPGGSSGGSAAAVAARLRALRARERRRRLNPHPGLHVRPVRAEALPRAPAGVHADGTRGGHRGRALRFALGSRQRPPPRR